MCNEITKLHFHLPSPLCSSFWSFPVFQPCPRPHPDRMAAAWGDWLGASVRPPPLEGIIKHSCICRAGGAEAEELPGSCKLSVSYLQSANKQGSDINILLQQRLTLPRVPVFIDVLWIREDAQSIFFFSPWHLSSCAASTELQLSQWHVHEMRFCRGKKIKKAAVPQLKQACGVFFGGRLGSVWEQRVKSKRHVWMELQHNTAACFSFKIRLQELTGIMVHVTWSWSDSDSTWYFFSLLFFPFL